MSRGLCLAVAQMFSPVTRGSTARSCVFPPPVQNIGAYGHELSTVLSSVDFLDEVSVQPRRILASELGLGYRDSLFKQGWLRGIISAIELDLVPPTDSPTATLSESVAFEQL